MSKRKKNLRKSLYGEPKREVFEKENELLSSADLPLVPLAGIDFSELEVRFLGFDTGIEANPTEIPNNRNVILEQISSAFALDTAELAAVTAQLEQVIVEDNPIIDGIPYIGVHEDEFNMYGEPNGESIVDDIMDVNSDPRSLNALSALIVAYITNVDRNRSSAIGQHIDIAKNVSRRSMDVRYTLSIPVYEIEKLVVGHAPAEVGVQHVLMQAIQDEENDKALLRRLITLINNEPEIAAAIDCKRPELRKTINKRVEEREMPSSPNVRSAVEKELRERPSPRNAGRRKLVVRKFTKSENTDLD